MIDPQFLADAKKRKLDIHPRNAAKTHALVDTMVARVKKAIGVTGSSDQ